MSFYKHVNTKYIAKKAGYTAWQDSRGWLGKKHLLFKNMMARQTDKQTDEQTDRHSKVYGCLSALYVCLFVCLFVSPLLFFFVNLLSHDLFVPLPMKVGQCPLQHATCNRASISHFHDLIDF